MTAQSDAGLSAKAGGPVFSRTSGEDLADFRKPAFDDCMGIEHDQKINELSRATGKTRAELLTEARDALLGEPTGVQRWVEAVKSKLRGPTAADRENRHIFEENQARSHAEMARELQVAKAGLDDQPAEKRPRER